MGNCRDAVLNGPEHVAGALVSSMWAGVGAAGERVREKERT